MPINNPRPGGQSGFITPTGVEVMSNKTLGDNSKYEFEDVTIASNTFARPTGTVARITSGTGPLNTITGGNDGNILVVENKTGGAITITNDSGANGFLTGTGANFSLADDDAMQIVYNAADGRWSILGGPTAGTVVATADTAGVVTSFAPTVKSSYHTVTSANYTVLDSDGYSIIMVTTGAVDRTITLPTASANDGRTIKIIKKDSGTGKVNIQGEAAGEKVAGISGTTGFDLMLQFDYAELICDGVEWHCLSYREISKATSFSTVSNVATNVQAQDGYWSKRGNRMIIQATLEWSGADSTSSSVDPIIPLSLALDESEIPSGFSDTLFDSVAVGYWYFGDKSTVTAYSGTIVWDLGSNFFRLRCADGSFAGVNPGGNDPVIIADGDYVGWFLDIPISEWANSVPHA